jgi:hypothetical protein
MNRTQPGDASGFFVGWITVEKEGIGGQGLIVESPTEPPGSLNDYRMDSALGIVGVGSADPDAVMP